MNILTRFRTCPWLALASLLIVMPVSAGGPAPVPAGVFPLLVSPVHDYILYFDPLPSNPLPNANFYPGVLALDDRNALDDGTLGSLASPAGYHAGYKSLAFRDPYFTGTRDVFFYDCNFGTGDCDSGMARFTAIYMPAPTYITQPEIERRRVLGHELFHHVQYAYINAAGISTTTCSSTWPKTVCEGQARAMEDKIYADIDLFAGGFHAEAIDYLQQPDQDIWQASYEAALFWAYLMEQYGDISTNPLTGADFLARWWETAETQGASTNAVAATEDTIQYFAPTHSLISAFHDFTIANYTKDLDLSQESLAFRDRYRYIDEQLQSGPDYTTVKMEPTGVVTPGTTVRPFAVNRLGAEYRPFDLTGCPTGRVLRFDIQPETAVGDEGFIDSLDGIFSIIVERNNRPVGFYKQRADSYTVSFPQAASPYDQAVVISSGRYGALFGDITVKCDLPVSVFEPTLPKANPSNPQAPGPAGSQALGSIAVHIPDPIDPALPFPALDRRTLDLWVGQEPARILGIVPERDNYLVKFQYPLQSSNGLFDLTVALGDRSATVANAVRHGTAMPEVVVAVDTSSTVLSPLDGPILDALKQAMPILFDALPDDYSAALLEYSGNNTEPGMDSIVLNGLEKLSVNHRAEIADSIATLNSGPGRFTSIGDALRLGLRELDANGTVGEPRHLILFCDGAENEGEFWSDVREDILDSGLAVHTVAIGGFADQGLLQQIALDTGGLYFYVDVQSTGTDLLDLVDAITHLTNHVTGQVMIAQRNLVVAPGKQTSGVQIPAGGFHFPLTISVTQFNDRKLSSILLHSADGTTFTGEFSRGQFSQTEDFSVTPVFIPGKHLELQVDSEVQSARLNVSVTTGIQAIPHLDVSVASNNRSGNALFDAGTEIDLHALVSSSGGANNAALVSTVVTRPDGTSQEIAHSSRLLAATGTDTTVDPKAWHAAIRSTDQGSNTGLADGTNQPPQRGSYQTWTTAEVAQDGVTYQIINRLDFHLLDIGSDSDSDDDGLRDNYELQHSCLDQQLPDASQDPDDDMLTNTEELDYGTDPCHPDSDRSGELDGSEVARGNNPLSGKDDARLTIDYAYIATRNVEHEPVANLFEPGGLTIRYAAPRISSGQIPSIQYVIERARARDGQFLEIATIDPLEDLGHGLGNFVDRGLEPGETYDYRIYAIDADGNRGPNTSINSGVARSDSEPPIGDITLDDGGLHGEDGSVIAHFRLYNKIAARTDMQVSINGEIGPWQSFKAALPLALLGQSETELMHVAVQYRDSGGNLSGTYSQTLNLHAADTTGEIRGRILTAPDSNNSALGAVVQVRDPIGIANAIADAEGNFELRGLPPGEYFLTMDRDGYLTETRNLRIGNGETVELADITLLSSDDVLFEDTFE